MFSLNTEANIGQCNFYFTIPAANTIPSVQFAYLPQLTLSASQNYANIPIPWAFPTEQFFTYKIPSNLKNNVHIATIDKLNRAVISDLYFSTNDTYYSSLDCSSTFPTESSQYSHCNITATNYSVGNMDYYKFTFALNSENSHVVLGFMTHQNGSYNSFNFGNSSPSQNTTCPTGQYYNFTQSQCIECSLTLDYCIACSDCSTCNKCSDNKMQIISGKCTCNDGYYKDPSQGCKQCSSVLPNCELCSNSTVCTKCQTGYYLPSGKSTSCVIAQPIYNWDLTDLSTSWQNGPELYWSFELNYTQNMTNIYSLLLTTNETVHQTPGTIYIFYNINYSLHNVYVSTNCSTVETCSNQTEAPSKDNYCWVAGSQSVWSMNTKQTQGQCYFYLSIPELTEIPQAQLAFFPQLTLSGIQNYTNLPVPWVFQTEQIFTYKFPDNYVYKNAQNGLHTINLSGMNENIVSSIYLATNDPIYNSKCSTGFPEQSANCRVTSSSYPIYKLYIADATSSIVLGFITNSYDNIYYFDFNSNFTFSCNENYILSNDTCVKQTSSCSEGYYYNKTLLDCVECSSGLSYCHQCSQTGESCTECLTGSDGKITLIDGKCLVTCDSGNYPNPEAASAGLCLSCMAHCIQCRNASTCEECYEPTYKWNSENNKCESICKEGYYYDTDKQSCINCEVEYCTVCYGSGNQCSECTDGYQPMQNNQDDYACQKIEKKPKYSYKMPVTSFVLFTLFLILFIEI